MRTPRTGLPRSSDATALDAGAGRCPFCGEVAREGARCPACDLPLVPHARAAAPAAHDEDDDDPRPPEDRPLGVAELGSGRGWLLASGLALLVGPALPLVRTAPEGARVVTGFGLALEAAPNLWAIPCVGLWLLATLRARRTPRALRGARLAVPLLGLLAAAALVYSFLRMARAAAALEVRYAVDVPVEPLVGVYAIGAGVAAALVAGLRLGAVPRG